MYWKHSRPTPTYSKTRKKVTLRKSDNYSKTFWTNFGQGMKKARFNGLFKVVLIHPEGIEPPSQEPESYVISITLRVERKNLRKASFIGITIQCHRKGQPLRNQIEFLAIRNHVFLHVFDDVDVEHVFQLFLRLQQLLDALPKL